MPWYNLSGKTPHQRASDLVTAWLRDSKPRPIVTAPVVRMLEARVRIAIELARYEARRERDGGEGGDHGL